MDALVLKTWMGGEVLPILFKTGMDGYIIQLLTCYNGYRIGNWVENE